MNFTLGEHSIYLEFGGGDALDSIFITKEEMGVNESHNAIYPLLYLVGAISLGTWIHNHLRLKWHLLLQVSVLEKKRNRAHLFPHIFYLFYSDMEAASLKYAIYFAPTLRNYKVVTHCENSHQLKVNIAIFFSNHRI